VSGSLDVIKGDFVWGLAKEAFEKRGLDANAGMRWALGDNYGSSDVKQTASAWNERHAETFTLSNNDDCAESLDRIAQAFADYLLEGKK
jgi:hypothetical protein